MAKAKKKQEPQLTEGELICVTMAQAKFGTPWAAKDIAKSIRDNHKRKLLAKTALKILKGLNAEGFVSMRKEGGQSAFYLSSSQHKKMRKALGMEVKDSPETPKPKKKRRPKVATKIKVRKKKAKKEKPDDKPEPPDDKPTLKIRKKKTTGKAKAKTAKKAKAKTKKAEAKVSYNEPTRYSGAGIVEGDGRPTIDYDIILAKFKELGDGSSTRDVGFALAGNEDMHDPNTKLCLRRARAGLKRMSYKGILTYERDGRDLVFFMAKKKKRGKSKKAA